MSTVDITGSASKVLALVRVPRIDLPRNIQADNTGGVVFQIASTDGDIAVLARPHTIYCKGSAKALIAAGLVKEEWLPGVPGNNSVRQTVSFDCDGSHLITNKSGPRTTLPHIVIVRCSRRSYEVMIPPTAEQKKSLEEIVEKWITRNAQEHREKEEAEAKKRLLAFSAKTASDWKIRLAGVATAFRYRFTRDSDAAEHLCDLFMYDEESNRHILKCINELELALLNGKAISRHQHRHEGNVTYLHGN